MDDLDSARGIVAGVIIGVLYWLILTGLITLIW
jgi:hypothetical protein